METAHYFEILKLAAPECLLVVAALAVLGTDLWPMRQKPLRQRLLAGGALSILGCVAALFWMINTQSSGSAGEGMLVVNSITQWAKGALVLLAGLTILLSVERDFTQHAGEYLALVLLATVGMMLLVSSENLLMVFLSLELTSLSLYILAAFNKSDPRSTEAALKYFLFGGMAAAFTLFGLSWIYGLTGELQLSRIASAVQGVETANPMLMGALILTVIGFGFKIAVVPFHLWAPDAYQGAPTPSAALIASGSKVASFIVLARVIMVGFDGAEGDGSWWGWMPGWMPLLALLAALSMLLGNLAALAQSNVKRLLAYSAIAHAGYALLGIMADSGQGVSSIIYYSVTYALAALGAFGVVAVVEERAGGSALSDFAGFGREQPVLSLCMMIFMLSLAGIPPLAGFFGKFYLFAAAMSGDRENLGLLWLVILAIAMSAVSLYYYLQVLKQIYVAPVLPSRTSRVRCGFTRVAVVIAAAGVVVLGCFPNLLVSKLVSGLRLAGF